MFKSLWSIRAAFIWLKLFQCFHESDQQAIGKHIVCLFNVYTDDCILFYEMSCLAGLWCQLSFFLTFFMGKSSCHSMLIMVFVPPGWDKRRKARERERGFVQSDVN